MAEEEGEAKAPVPGPSSPVSATAATKTTTSATPAKATSEAVSYLADDFEVISAQATAKDDPFHKSLSECFQLLRESRDEAKPLFSQEDPTEESEPRMKGSILNQVSTAVTVNFIDPTTKPNHGPKPDNTLAAAAKSAKDAAVIENVYEKLTHVFQRDYGSTLRSIQYRNIRTGENDVITSLPVHPVLFGAGGSLPANGNAPWGGTGTSALPSDPSEWHTGPFCHVYIAACQGLDHYRNKIRPSLQAFVSQLESAATQPQLASTGGQGGHSAHYLVVYIPMGPKDKESDNGKPQNARNAVASRLSMVRRRFANAGSREDLDGSQHSKDSLDSNDVPSEGDDAEAAAASFNLLSKSERNIYKKIAADFPNGKVCALSRGSLSHQLDTEADSSSGFAVKTQEWNSFNRCLGAVIVNGFKDRCRRYQDELRRLDAERASQATASKNGKDTIPSSFNLSHFFLVKESLAFTYEQMHLPAEALLQYDEFRAFLPDLSDSDYQKAKKDRKECRALQPEEGSLTLLELADAGEVLAFRRKVRSVTDLKPILDIMRRYLFARELCLLTKMEQPAELVARCRKFIKLMYTIMMRGISDKDPAEQKRRKAKAAEWVIQFSWDVKCTSERFLVSMAELVPTMDDAATAHSSPSLLGDTSEATQAERALARQLSELLDLVRLFYKELGDSKFGGKNPLRVYEKSLPSDMFEPWKPWVAREEKPVEDKPPSGPPKRLSIMQRASVPQINLMEVERRFILSEAFDSEEAYEDTYLEIASSLVTLNRFAGRKRIAARLQGEIAETLVRSGLLVEASEIFKKTVKICRWDHWDRCHFYRLFRLAYCQRTTAKPSEYLKTLVSAFSPRTTAVAPKSALLFLQDDLEAVIGHESVGESRYGKLAFLEIQFEVTDVSEDAATDMGDAFDRKQLLKKYCPVGDTVRIRITLNSNLPRAIELDSLQLFIVSFDTFSTVIENSESVEEEDAFKILSTDCPVKLAPGKNVYTLDWTPTNSGQYILSTAEIVWKQGFFYYDSMDLPEALHCVDVLPSDPTHSLTLEPEVLLPGHDQEVLISFNAADDFVTGGKLQLACSEGLTLIPPGEDPTNGNWQNGCEIDLGSCKQGESKTFIAHVRCGLLETFSHVSISETSTLDRSHGLSVEAITTYLHEESEDADHPMRNVTEVFAPILEKTALSVEGIDVIWITPGKRAMVNVNLISNTPKYFSVEEWDLVLPPPIFLTEGSDLNGDLLQCKVSDGDQLSLAFDCSVVEGKVEMAAEEPALKMKLRDDVGKQFTLQLPIDLTEHYLKVMDGANMKAPITATASLLVEATEGNVGDPLLLTFKIDEGDLGALDTIAYSILSDGSEWLVGGQVNGIIDKSSLSCEVVGIPAVAGPLSKFPSLILRHSPKDGEVVPLTTKIRFPQPFGSYPPTSEVAVAFPNAK
eukprot:scaffold2830_cov131-Cylindrotheca_fusiformis.AAC.99